MLPPPPPPKLSTSSAVERTAALPAAAALTDTSWIGVEAPPRPPSRTLILSSSFSINISLGGGKNNVRNHIFLIKQNPQKILPRVVDGVCLRHNQPHRMERFQGRKSPCRQLVPGCWQAVVWGQVGQARGRVAVAVAAFAAGRRDPGVEGGVVVGKPLKLST